MPDPAATTVAATLERLDVRLCATRALRECAAIAGRGHKKAALDPARVAGVIALLIAELEEAQAGIAEGRLPR